jgi:hypothetical protein
LDVITYFAAPFDFGANQIQLRTATTFDAQFSSDDSSLSSSFFHVNLHLISCISSGLQAVLDISGHQRSFHFRRHHIRDHRLRR